jgi:hypothetical protein
MTEIGEPIVDVVQIPGQSSIEYTADDGEKWKITMAYARAADGLNEGSLQNANLHIGLSSGKEDRHDSGYSTEEHEIPPLGVQTHGEKNFSGLAPVFVSDTRGMYLGNDYTEAIDVAVQGIRVY